MRKVVNWIMVGKVKTILGIGLLLFLMLFLWGCFPGAISGTVTDQATGKPVAGATITIGDKLTQTSASGSYQIANVSTGVHVLRITAPGYQEHIEELKVRQGAQIIDVALTPISSASPSPSTPSSTPSEKPVLPSNISVPRKLKYVSEANLEKILRETGAGDVITSLGKALIGTGAIDEKVLALGVALEIAAELEEYQGLSVADWFKGQMDLELSKAELNWVALVKTSLKSGHPDIYSSIRKALKRLLLEKGSNLFAKVGYVNAEEVFLKYKGTATAVQQFSVEKQKKEDELKQLQEQYKSEQISADEYQNKEQEIQKELQQLDLQLTAKVQQKMVAVITEVAQENAFTWVTRKKDVVLFTAPGTMTDLTDVVIARLNAEFENKNAPKSTIRAPQKGIRRIGYINAEEVFLKYKGTAAAVQQFKVEKQKKEEELKQLLEQYKSGQISADEYQSKVQEIQKELQKLDLQLTAKVQQEMIAVITEVAKEKGYDWVTRKKDVILYACPGAFSDLTDAILARLNLGQSNVPLEIQMPSKMLRKVAYVNTEEVFLKYKGTATAVQQFSVEKQKKEDELKQLQEQYKSGQISADEYQNKEQEIQKELQQLDLQLTAGVQQKMLDVISKVAQEKGYDWVTRKKDVVQYVKPGLMDDITNLIIERLNAKLAIEEKDTIPPRVTITSGPHGEINSDTVTFEWVGTDNATEAIDLVYSYYLEGYDKDWSEWTSKRSKTYTNLPDGSYTFYIKAKDEAGNIVRQSAKQIFTVKTKKISKKQRTVRDMALDIVETALQSDDREILSSARFYIVMLGDRLKNQPFSTELIRILRERITLDEEESIRLLRNEALASLGDKDAVRSLWNTLSNALFHDTEIIGIPELLLILIQSEAKGVAIKILAPKLSEEDPQIRVMVASLLGWLSDKRAVPSLLAALEDEHAGVRRAAAMSLGIIGHKSAIPALRKAQQDNDKTVRIAANAALAMMGDESVLLTLIDFLKEDNEDLSTIAAIALARVNNKEAILALKREIESNNEPVIEALASASMLGIRNKALIPSFRRLLKDKDENLQDLAIIFLIPLGDKLAIETCVDSGYPFLFLLRSINKSINKEDLKKLKHEIIPTLTQTLRDEQKDILERTSAALVLGEIGDRAVLEPLGEALQTEDEQLRVAAAMALLATEGADSTVLEESVVSGKETVGRPFALERPGPVRELNEETAKIILEKFFKSITFSFKAWYTEWQAGLDKATIAYIKHLEQSGLVTTEKIKLENDLCFVE